MLPMKAGLPSQALRLVPYLAPEEIKQLCSGCQGRHRERNALLILLLFQTGLRVSEALTLTVGHLTRQPGALEIIGKGGAGRHQRNYGEQDDGNDSHGKTPSNW